MPSGVGVRVMLHGDAFDDAAKFAESLVDTEGGPICPFDDRCHCWPGYSGTRAH